MKGKFLNVFPAFYIGKNLFVKIPVRFASESVVQLSLLYLQ